MREHQSEDQRGPGLPGPQGRNSRQRGGLTDGPLSQSLTQRRLQRVAANTPVARAQLLRLQGVENPQDLFWIAPHRHIVDGDVLDDVVRVYDEGCSQGNAFRAITHTQLIHQRARHVAELVMAQLLQLGLLAAPGQFHIFVIDRAAHHHGVTFGEVGRQVVEAHDLRRTYEGEVLRVEVDDLPLVREGAFGDVFECGYAVLLVFAEARLHAGDLERFQFVAYGFHRRSLMVWLAVRVSCPPTHSMRSGMRFHLITA